MFWRGLYIGLCHFFWQGLYSLGAFSRRECMRMARILAGTVCLWHICWQRLYSHGTCSGRDYMLMACVFWQGLYIHGTCSGRRAARCRRRSPCHRTLAPPSQTCRAATLLSFMIEKSQRGCSYRMRLETPGSVHPPAHAAHAVHWVNMQSTGQ